MPSRALIAKHPKVELDQLNCEFVPYTLAIHQDQTLVIKSSDPTNHNVHFSAFNNGGFNQILGVGGQLEKNLVAERFPIPHRMQHSSVDEVLSHGVRPPLFHHHGN